MSIRSYLNNNPAIVTIAAIVLLLVCLGVIYRTLSGGGGGPRIVDIYFYDLGSGEVFIGPSDSLPPIDAPSGPYNGKPAGVRAYVFSCTDCSDENSRFVGYLETYTDEAKAALTSGEAPDAYEYYDGGRLIKRPDEEGWARAESEEGFALIESVSTLCPGGVLKPCYPGR